MGTIAELVEYDRGLKPAGADEEWLRLNDYYNDNSRELTIEFNKTVGAGLEDAPRPLEISLLRRIVDRIAIVYAVPPTRRLLRDDEALPDEAPAMKALSRAYRRALMDVSFRRADRLRALFRQCVIRFYPSDAQRSVVMRVFEPYNVVRRPDASSSDQIETDHEFGLCLAKTPAGEVWEHWTRDPESGTWSMLVVNEKGEPMADQPFKLSGGANPYGLLPVLQIYDEIPHGRAWLAPRCSRSSWASAVNALVNNLWELVHDQAHDNIAFAMDDPNAAPTDTGPGSAWALERGDTVQRLSGNPKIAEAERVLTSLLATWCISEDLPANEFDRSKSIVTGVALMVQERGLNVRRRELVPLAELDERLAYERFTAIHNLHCMSWGLEPLATDVELLMQAGEIRPPRDPAELIENTLKEVALGTASPIDLIMRLHGCDRPTAIRMWRQAQDDLEAYPPRQAAGALQTGPRGAGLDATPTPGELHPQDVHDAAEANMLDGAPSTVAAATS